MEMDSSQVGLRDFDILFKRNFVIHIGSLHIYCQSFVLDLVDSYMSSAWTWFYKNYVNLVFDEMLDCERYCINGSSWMGYYSKYGSNFIMWFRYSCIIIQGNN